MRVLIVAVLACAGCATPGGTWGESRTAGDGSGCEFFARNASGDGARDEHIDDAVAFGAVVDERHRAGIVDGGRGVGHADDRRETAARGGGGAGGDGFLGGLARFAQVDVQINQARTNDKSAGVELINVFRCFARGVRAYCGNFPVNNEQIRSGIETIGRVNDPSAGQKQRVHARSA